MFDPGQPHSGFTEAHGDFVVLDEALESQLKVSLIVVEVTLSLELDFTHTSGE